MQNSPTATNSIYSSMLITTTKNQMELTKLYILLLLPTLSLLPLSESGTDASKGRWKLLNRSIGMSAMHMQLLPNDKVVVYDRTDAGRSKISLPNGKCIIRQHCNKQNICSDVNDCTAHSVEFDPKDHTVRPLTVLSETFCSSGALLPNGTLIQTGGDGRGDHVIRYFSPCDGCDWVEDKLTLAVRRWYATNHILPDGRVIVIGGRLRFASSYEFVPKLSISDSVIYNLPFLVETKDRWENNLYPFVHLSTDGNLFIFANTKSILLDYVNNRIVKSFPELTKGISRNYPSTGSSVLLPLRLDHKDANVKAEVMICGGTQTSSLAYAANGTFLPASASCGRMSITDESPSWELSEMPVPRTMGDMILLPTADVLIINGVGHGTAGWGNGRDPVFTPVIYRTGVTGNDSCRGAFDTMNPSGIPRVYHSTALLIPDGRVLVSGSNAQIRYEFKGVLFPTELTMEAFFPPYLGVRRPVIKSIEQGPEFRYGDKMTISFAVKGVVSTADVHVTMIAPSFATHSFSMNQRLLVVELGELSHDRGEFYQLEAVAPASAVLAPPGYYMLFVVHCGIPSKGMWVRLS